MSLEHSPARQRKAAGTPVYEPSYTPDEFCAAERISRSKLYEYWKTGRGPRYYLNGVSRRITHAARLQWQQQRMDETHAQKRVQAERGEIA